MSRWHGAASGAVAEKPDAPLSNIEAEQAILGAVLLDEGVLEKAAELVHPGSFYLTAHQKIYAAMLELAKANERIDNITLADRLQVRGELDQAGGAAYLAELVGAVPSAANVQHHSRIVAEKAQIRALRAGLGSVLCAADTGANLSRLTAMVHELPSSLPSALLGCTPQGLTRMADVKPRLIQWLWPGRIPRGKLTVFDGDPGLGKSLLTLDLAACVSTGRAMPDGRCGHLDGPRGVVLLSAEDDPGDTIRPRLEAAGAALDRICVFEEVHDNGKPRAPHLGDVAALRSAIHAVDAALVVIDPLMAYVPDTRDTHRDQDIRRLLAPLAELAAETGASFLVVRHLNKGQHGNPLYRGGGSIGIVGAARSGLLVAPDPDDADGQTRVLALTKSNLAAPPPSLRYRVIERNPGAAGIEWLGESPQNAANLLLAAAESKEVRTERDDATDWLRDALSSGPVPVKDLEKQAKAAGHAWVTVRRAKVGLGINAAKQGFQGEWTWQLPKEDHSREVISFGQTVGETPQNPAKNAKEDPPSKGDHLGVGKGGDHLWNERDGEILDL